MGKAKKKSKKEPKVLTPAIAQDLHDAEFAVSCAYADRRNAVRDIACNRKVLKRSIKREKGARATHDAAVKHLKRLKAKYKGYKPAPPALDPQMGPHA